MTGPTNPGRRAFLGAGAAAAFSTVASPAFASLGRAQYRLVALDNLHTGEKLNVHYWVNGHYVRGALHQVNYNLRDFRNGHVHAIDPQLLDLLDGLRRLLNTGEPFQVISGYRSPETNAMLHEESNGVAVNSLHVQGRAIDIRLAGRSLRSLHKAAVRLRRGGVGYYPSADFVHVDVGRVRYW
ncbi:MAG: DUF882 domain-containing protein [Alphaproteobacteria bacterium]